MAGTVEASRFQAALSMADTGVRLVRQRLRREDPAASEADIDVKLRRWLAGRPMDAAGHVQVRSRR